MKSSVQLYYKRPSSLEENAELICKDYTRYANAFSYAVDSAIRLALSGYYVQITINDVAVLTWEENFIRDLYRY